MSTDSWIPGQAAKRSLEDVGSVLKRGGMPWVVEIEENTSKM